MSNNPKVTIAIPELEEAPEHAKDDLEKIDRVLGDQAGPSAEAGVLKNQASLANFTHSIEEMPSGFRPYDFDELHIRALTVGEVKRVRSALESANLAVFYDALGGAMSVHPRELTHGDFWFILLWQRQATFPDVPFSLNWTCEGCRKDTKSDLDLTEIQFTELPEEYKEPATMSLPSGEKVQLRKLRIGDELTTKKYLEKVKKKKNYNMSDAWLVDIAQSMISDDTLDQKLNKIAKMSPNDITYVDQFQALFTHGLPDFVSMTCTEADDNTGEVCGTVSEQVPLQFQLLDLVPNRGDSGRIKHAIIFS